MSFAVPKPKGTSYIHLIPLCRQGMDILGITFVLYHNKWPASLCLGEIQRSE